MTTVVEKPLRKLLTFLDRLEREKVWYRLEHVRDSILVTVSIPGERLEVEFFDDGTVEVERFRSSGKIEGEEALDALLMEPDGEVERDAEPAKSRQLGLNPDWLPPVRR